MCTICFIIMKPLMHLVFPSDYQSQHYCIGFAICEPNVQKMWKLRLLTKIWILTACYINSFTLQCVRFGVTVKISLL